MRDVNPCNGEIEKLTTDSRNGFSFLVKINKQTNKLTEVTKFGEV